MKITYLHQYFNTPQMTGITRSYEMARRLVASGHEVTMITSDRGKRDGNWTRSNVEGIDVHWFPVPYSNHMSYRDRIRAFYRFAWAAARKAASIEADLIFATSTPLTIALPAVFAKRRQRVPLVLEIRDLWPELPIAVGALKHPLSIRGAQWLERFAYANSDHVVALSPGMAEGVAGRGYPTQHITVIPNSSDNELFSVPESAGRAFRLRHDWLGDRPLILYAGTLGRLNGVDYLVRLAARIRSLNPEIRFLIVGDGHERDAVMSLARETGVLSNSLFFMDPVAKAAMPEVLSAATIATSLFIDLPAMWKNSANKFFDALAASRPIAINYRGWQADLLIREGAGLVLSPENLEDSAARLAHAAGDGAWQTAARCAARKLAEHEFNRDRLASQLEHVLRTTALNAGSQRSRTAARG
jgi:glycosyltransferase involved in cell wall biosynthesis